MFRPPTAPLASPTRRPAGRVLVWAARLVALLVGAFLAALTWGPNLARGRIADFYGNVIGREIRIGHIEVSPFAGRVVVDDVSIASTRPDRPALAVRRATVDIDASAYLHGVVVVKGVRLESPALHLVRIGPDRFDFSEVLDRFANRPALQRKATWRIDRVAVEDGQLDLDDQVVKKATSIAGLSLRAVGLTNQDEHLERPATLDARFTLDGRPVAVQARATPFSSNPVFGGNVKLDALPIAALLPYLPLPADIRPVSGTVTLDLGGTWRQTAAAPGRLDVSGRLTFDGLGVHDGAGTERVAAESLVVVLGSSQPLGGEIHVTEATLRAPRAALGRDAAGRMLWLAAADSGAGTQAPAAPAAVPTTAQPSAEPPAAAPLPAASTQPQGGPRSLRIDRLIVDGARIDWQDAALAAPLALQVSPLALSLEAIEVADLSRPAAASGRGRLDATVDGQAELGADLLLDGSGSGRTSVTLSRIDVARYAPLAGPALRATIEQGRLTARATLAWGPEGAGLSVTDAAAELADLRIAKDGRVPVTIASLDMAGGSIDLTARRIELGSVKLVGGTLQARRDLGGRVDLQDWWVQQDTDASAGRDVPAWSVRVARAEVAALAVDYDDAATPKASKLPKLTLNAKASNLGIDPSQTMPFEAAVALADGSRLSARGSLRPAPLQLDAQVRLAQFGITNVEPYVAPYVNLALAGGQLWSKGRLRLTGDQDDGIARIGFDGEFSANNFRAIDRVTSDDFLRWTALALPSIKVDWRTDRPADSLIEIGAVAFVDFYTRLILSPEGQLNLSDVVADPRRDRRAAPRSLTAAPASTVPAEAARAPAGLAGPAVSATSTPLPAPSTGPRPTIRVGTVRIASGNVNFTDLFIRPNYTANLTQLVGSIEAIASDRAEPSDVLVTGRVDDDTPLEITGKINPLAPTRFIDLRAVARGFDLPKLSPYTGRWAGYAIEKGKLTADVRYRIEGERLSAENKLTINQLTFGEKIDSPEATSLPVRFAMSLLKDRNGNIDLDLPISGTVSDPQFSVGGLLWRALGNLIVKVVASPFTVLASLGGSDAGELSHIEFAAGATALDDEDRKRLDTLSTALAQRPELSIEIAGVGDPKADREALQQARLERSLKSAKLAQMRRAMPSAEFPPIAELVLDAAERPMLLERVWRDAKLDAGRTGKVPPPEALEQLLLEHVAVATEEVKQIAQLRAQAARDYLRERRGILNERLYLLAPRIADDASTLTPRRADFTLK